MKKGFVIYINNIGILSHKLIDFLSTCQVDEKTLRFLIKELEVKVSRQLGTYLLDNAIKIVRDIIDEKQNRG